MITCDEIIDAEEKSFDEKTKTAPTNFNGKKQPVKHIYFTCIFINYYSIFDSCYFLLLCDKISSKIKTLVTNNELKEIMH